MRQSLYNLQYGLVNNTAMIFIILSLSHQKQKNKIAPNVATEVVKYLEYLKIFI